MKNLKLKNSLKTIVLLAVVLSVTLSCERDLSDDVVDARFSTVGDIFTDDFVGMGSDFYFPYGGSKLDAFSVDNTMGYESNASYRVDVPNATDPNGNYAGAILRIDGAGRDLTGYDALTFWAKASQGVVIGEAGFGEDFGDNKYLTTLFNVSLSTVWTKVIIPIPDASKLVEERGMFRYSMGTQDTGGNGYTVWFDDIRFEKLGTIAHPRPAILEGQDQIIDSFIGSDLPIAGLTQTFNTATGDVTVSAAPMYYDFTSSDTAVADVNVSVEEGAIATVNAVGSTVITASLADVAAAGSLTISSLGSFSSAPTPTRDPSEVISIFSDAYTNVDVDYYNGFFNGDGQTTLGGAPPANFGGDNVINYTNLNFVGIGTFLNVPTVDASGMSHIHVDIQVRESIDPGDFIRFQLINDVGGNETSGNVTFTSADLQENQWVGFDIPLANFSGLAGTSQMGLIFFVSDDTISNIFVDNIYYYSIPTSPTTAAPTPTQPAANVISIFSDAYTDVAGSDYNPNWGQATAVTQESIGGDNTLKYAGLNYQGLVLGSNQDVSGMSFLHIDYFSASSSALNVYLISPGPVETPKALTVPTNGMWMSVDIPLSDFSPVDLTNIFQMKFDGNGDIYLDNIYFY